jgi:predicted DNA-binding transcriptional regulator AlpA
MKEAMKILCCSKKTSYKLTGKKDIPHYKKIGKLSFRESELIEYMESGKVKTTSELEQFARNYKETYQKKVS